MKSHYMALFLALLLVLPASPMLANQQKVVIISNSADMPAAQELKSQLSSAGVSVSIKPASGFDEAMSSQYVTEIIILGGPDAYEGVGQISAKFLNKQDQQYLRSSPGASVVRRFTKTSGGVEKEILIMAGSTRKETKLSSEVYSMSGFPGSKLAETAPKIVMQSTGTKLTYRLTYLDKKTGKKNVTTMVVEKFSGTVNGEKADGYKWVFQQEMQGYSVKVEYYSVYTQSGKSCVMEKASYMGQSMVIIPWKCYSAGETSESPGGGAKQSDMLKTNMKTGMKTVPAGTFFCLIFTAHQEDGGTSTVWYSPQVPLTHLVASEYDGPDSRVYLELMSIG